MALEYVLLSIKTLSKKIPPVAVPTEKIVFISRPG
jgi:hypothetical protein